jgi:flagella basal body P-ring formation protein FlgA
MDDLISAAIIASLSVGALQGVHATAASAQAAPSQSAGGVVTTRILPAGAVVTAADVRLKDPGNQSDVDALAAMIGKETRRVIPEGSILSDRDLKAETLVQRNAVVRMEFAKGLLSISADGRALSSGAYGETIKVMNLDSRATVSAIVIGRGKVAVQ